MVNTVVTGESMFSLTNFITDLTSVADTRGEMTSLHVVFHGTKVFSGLSAQITIITEL